MKMTRGLMWVLMMAVGTVSVVSPGSAKAQKSTIDYRKMERDLGIMENILEKLLSSEEMDPLHFERDFQGFYLENYGVVFYAPRTSLSSFGLSRLSNFARLQTLQIRKQYEEAQKHYKELAKQLTGKGKEDEEEISEAPEPLGELGSIEKPEDTTAAQALETLKANLAEFLGNYADAIRQLKPSDAISIIVDFGGSESFAASREEPIKRLIAQASKREISEFRQANGDLQAFQKRIGFTMQTAHQKVDRDIEILASIFETAVKQRYPEAFGATSETNGLYLDPLGALFFMKVNLSSPLTLLSVPPGEVLSLSEKSGVRSRETKSSVVVSMMQEKKQREESWRERVNQLKDETVEILKDYGQTLRKLKADDWVVMAVDLGESWDEARPRTMLMTAKKSDIDAANKERITLEEFKRRVEVREY